MPGKALSAIDTESCLAGLSLANWIDSESSPKRGGAPVFSFMLARMFSVVKCSLPTTVTEVTTASTMLILTVPPTSSCSGTVTFTAV